MLFNDSIMDLHHTPAHQAIVSDSERALSIIAGTLLLYHAIKLKPSLLEVASASYLIYRGTSGHCPLRNLTEQLLRKRMNVNIRTSLTVNRSVDQVYGFWRKLENLPLFMKHLSQVTVLSPTESEWKATLPFYGDMQWKAMIVKEKLNEMLGWSSVPEAAVHHAGKVVFSAIGDDVTELQITISFRPPLGTLGENISRAFTGKMEAILLQDIKNFKAYLEAGAADPAGPIII